VITKINGAAPQSQGWTTWGPAILLAFGGLTIADASRVDANLPTPWPGLWERINIGVVLLWIVVLAIVLLRKQGEER
jgi:hypothetical protein